MHNTTARDGRGSLVRHDRTADLKVAFAHPTRLCDVVVENAAPRAPPVGVGTSVSRRTEAHPIFGRGAFSRLASLAVLHLAETNNRKGSKEAVSALRGVPLALVSVTFAEDLEVYPSFRLHPAVDVQVQRTDTREEGRHPSFDVLVEYGGRWKLLNLDEL